MKILNLFPILFVIVMMSSCSIGNMSMREPNHHIEFYSGDFEYSPQVVAEATSVKVLMIDWQRLIKWNSGKIESSYSQSNTSQVANVALSAVVDPLLGSLTAIIPVLGEYGKGTVSNYALYNLMSQNPGYDVVVYPQYESKKMVIPFIYSKCTVKVKARLGKIK